MPAALEADIDRLLERHNALVREALAIPATTLPEVMVKVAL